MKALRIILASIKKADEEYNYYLRYDDFIAPIIKYCQELYKQNQETLIELNSLKEQVKIAWFYYILLLYIKIIPIKILL